MRKMVFLQIVSHRRTNEINCVILQSINELYSFEIEKNLQGDLKYL